MIIDLRIGRTNYKVNCHDCEQEKILELADRLNDRIDDLSQEVTTADDKTLLLIVALMLEEEVARLKNDESFSEARNEEILETLSETINNIASHIEKIIEKTLA